jgi:ComEC/Rec2-related protein
LGLAIALHFLGLMVLLIFICAMGGVIGWGCRHLLSLHQWESAQFLCKAWAPVSTYRDLYQAIVCGSPLSSPEWKQTFINSGLIHILVVSGSHLLFLDQIVARLNISSGLRLLLIHIPFTCVAGFQPPVMRAVVQRGLQQLPDLRLSSCQVQALVTAFLLVAAPSWTQSLSFQLSWMCGILLSLPRLTRWPVALETSTKIFIGLIPFSAALGLISPLSILTNWLIAPLIGGVLFPISALCFVMSWLSFLVDGLWLVTVQVLNWLPMGQPTDLVIVAQSHLFWIPMSAQIILLLIEAPWCRKKLFSVY